VPLLVIILSICVVQFTYTQVVDLPWLIDWQIQQGGGNLTEEQRAQAVDTAVRIPPLAYGFIAAVPSAIIILVLYALIALYYLVVSFATNDGIKYGQWLALIAWCSLPTVFGQIASLVNLMVTDARFLPPQALNPLSFGNLLNIDPKGASAVEGVLLQLDVTTLWSTVLQILGYQAFTGRSAGVATAVVLGPLAIIVLIASILTLT
jgi:hypothetical protein